MRMMEQNDYIKVYRRLRLMHIVEVAIIIVLAPSLTLWLDIILINLGVVKVVDFRKVGLLTFFTFILTSIILGSCLALFTSKFLLKPINNLIRGMEQLSQGKFDTRLKEKSNYFDSVVVSFNSLAKELQSIEILRKDFINNFSHELKTPIVSMLGLISLMKSKNISKEKQIYYVSIIEEELKRLSFMTTNILNMTKLENQSILMDKTTYNLSEQLRRCVLSFEKAWTEKELEIKMQLDEYEINGNEDFLKQVWVNLLDNAIKFSNKGGELKVKAYAKEGKIIVSITNYGVTIPKENLNKIFNKFYQVDQTYSKQGNGIGLSIVNKIVELHQGTISVESENDLTTFTVSLPQ